MSVRGGDGQVSSRGVVEPDLTTRKQSRFERWLRHRYGNFYSLLIKFVVERKAQDIET